MRIAKSVEEQENMNKAQAKKQLNKLVDLKSLPKNKARVEIAKDVIAALALNRLVANRGSYLRLSQNAKDGSLREQLPNVDCEVCGIGACFVALVARNNDFNLNLTSVMYDDFLEIHNVSDAHMEQLHEYFDDYQLGAIECAFEQTEQPITRLVGVNDCELFQNALEFGERHIDSENALIAIMQNIIDNDGEFIP